MAIYLNENLTANEITQNAAIEAAKNHNISYRANPNNTLERNPEQDFYEKKSSTGKKLGIFASLLVLAAVIVGGICYHRGGSNEVKSFTQRIKDGWKNFPFRKNTPNLETFIENLGIDGDCKAVIDSSFIAPSII